MLECYDFTVMPNQTKMFQNVWAARCRGLGLHPIHYMNVFYSAVLFVKAILVVLPYCNEQLTVTNRFPFCYRQNREIYSLPSKVTKKLNFCAKYLTWKSCLFLREISGKCKELSIILLKLSSLKSLKCILYPYMYCHDLLVINVDCHALLFFGLSWF